MKKRTNILLVVLILVCLAAFFGYRMLDGLRTDNRAPEIFLEDVIPELSVTDPADVLLQGVSARDKVDGDVTDSLLVEKVALLDGTGRVSVTYAAFDGAGNVAKAQREARYTDYSSPKFTLSIPLIYRYGTNFDVLNAVGVSDVIDGDIRHRIRATSLGEESVLESGHHEVEFRVTNSLGDTAVLVLPVDVGDMVAYEAALQLKQYLLYLPQGADFDPESCLQSFTLKGKTKDLSAGLPSGYKLETEGTVDTDTPGVYTVDYRVHYSEKYQSEPVMYREYSGYSRLVVVVEG